MKLFLLATLLSYTLATTAPVTLSPGATSASRCNKVASSTTAATNTTCLMCLQWGATTARFFNAGNCTATLSTGVITNCKIYNGQQTNTVSTTLPASDACIKCKKSYFNWTKATTATNITATCDSSKGTGCTGTISNCLQTNCHSTYNPSATTTIYSSQYCKYCNNGYQPANLDIWDLGATKCVSGTTLSPNCVRLMASTSLATAPTCVACAKNFAVGNGLGSCVGFTSDENCMVTAGAGEDGCTQCWSAYYFNVSTCTLSSKVLAGFAMALAALVWFN